MPKLVMMAATIPMKPTRVAAMRQSTVNSNTIAPMKSTIGGTIFHANPPKICPEALPSAVMRLPSAPPKCSVK